MLRDNGREYANDRSLADWSGLLQSDTGASHIVCNKEIDSTVFQ